MMDLKEVIEILKEDNPYSEDIFTPLGVKGRKPYIDAIKKAGLPVDSYSAELMRLAWMNCIYQIERIIEVEEEVEEDDE
jgi:hypothetical protein